MYSAVKIIEKSVLCKRIIKFSFEREDSAKPGQFYMVWLPGIDEFPLSIAEIEDNRRSIIIKIIGKGTEKLSEKSVGDKIWVRGPYGSSFELTENALIVGGGIGVAPLIPLIRRLRVYIAIVGAKTKDELIPIQEENVIYVTEDGSIGKKGTVVEVAEEILEQRNFSMVYGCGPEPMLYKLLYLCKKYGVKCQFSLERYMKCGIGLCGSCELDGYIVCREGPVFNGEILECLASFGKTKRDEYGKLVPI